MKAQWEKLSAKVDTLAPRERLMVLFALLVCVVALINAVLLDPLAARKKLLQARIDAESQQTVAIQVQIQSMINAGSVDPDAANKAKLASLQGQVLNIDSTLQSLQQGLVSPEKMPSMLETVLRKDPRLKLITLKTLPVSSLIDTAQPVTGQAAAVSTAPAEHELPIFRHGVQITIQGRYLDLMDYLVSLETLPWRVMWGGVSLTAGEFPLSSMTITVYTLSLDKEWLSI